MSRLKPVVSREDVVHLFAAVNEVYVDPLLKRWTVDLVRATRELDLVDLGASVRGSLALERAARAWALAVGREYVVPDDIELLFAPVLGHRLILAPDVLVDERVGGEDVQQRIWEACLERAPRPGPEWEPATAPAG